MLQARALLNKERENSKINRLEELAKALSFDPNDHLRELWSLCLENRIQIPEVLFGIDITRRLAAKAEQEAERQAERGAAIQFAEGVGVVREQEPNLL